MAEEPLTNRELIHQFRDVHTKLDKVITQVEKTNGRVTSLEKWRWGLSGGGLVIMGTVIPLIIYIWSNANSLIK